ncbi:MAG: hypothetical protein OXE86_21060 [Alphaproteobacteria bacterium]|nr:hypothetical protein [Alphaproteobacteria bacterium]
MTARRQGNTARADVKQGSAVPMREAGGRPAVVPADNRDSDPRPAETGPVAVTGVPARGGAARPAAREQARKKTA